MLEASRIRPRGVRLRCMQHPLGMHPIRVRLRQEISRQQGDRVGKNGHNFLLKLTNNSSTLCVELVIRSVVHQVHYG